MSKRPADHVIADYASAAKFLGGLPTKRINVCGIWPEGDRPMVSHSFNQTPDGIAGCAKFLTKYGHTGYNLYFYPNNLAVTLSKSKRADGKLVYKAKEYEVASVAMLHVDLDPPDDTKQENMPTVKAVLIERAKAHTPAPSIIIDSGNGLGLFWVLDKPITVTPATLATLKGYNKKLAADLDGDSAFNLDRVMRIPYTINIPNKPKLRRGRVAVEAAVIYDGTLTDEYGIDLFTSAHIDADDVGVTMTSGSEYEQIGSPDVPDKVDLSKLPPKLQAEIVNGAPAGADRSAIVYGVACDLRRAGWSDGLILHVLTNPDYKISDHILDQKQRDPLDQAARVILDMNAKHVEKVVETEAAEDFNDDVTADAAKRIKIAGNILDLLNKTEANGCTADEADAAKVKAFSLANKYRITDAELSAEKAARIKRDKKGQSDETADTAPLHEAVEPNETWTSILENFVYITQQERFVRKKDGKIWPVPAFEKAFKSVRFWVNPGGKPPLSITQEIFDRGPNVMAHFDSFCFAPGQEQRYNDDYNQWLPSKFKPAEGDTALWDAHLKYLLPDKVNRDHVLDWMAWVYQHPTEHPEYAAAMIGASQGTGKTFLPTVLSRLLSSTADARLEQTTIESAHQTWPLRTKLPIIEIRTANDKLTGLLHHLITSGRPVKVGREDPLIGMSSQLRGGLTNRRTFLEHDMPLGQRDGTSRTVPRKNIKKPRRLHFSFSKMWGTGKAARLPSLIGGRE